MPCLTTRLDQEPCLRHPEHYLGGDLVERKTPAGDTI